MIRRSAIFLFLLCTVAGYGQSKSITQFRTKFKENSNMFFYSSTLKMLNVDNNAEIAEMLKDIEEIRVLNYNKGEQRFTVEEIGELKTSLQEENYNNIMAVNEKGSSIYLYNREKRGKTVGFVAIVDNSENLVLIDLIGSIDVKKFMELKQKLDSRQGNEI